MPACVFPRSPVLLFALVLPMFAGSPADAIRNFNQVDEHVYRGGQPTMEQFNDLAKIGVKTIIDLREPGKRSREEEKAVTAAGMRYINVPMTGLTPPTDNEINRILNILEDASAGPAFVHCMRGADRTGAVIASYRIDHDGWDNDRALKEAMSRGMSFFQFPRQSYIRHFKARAVEAKTVAPNSTPAAGSQAAPATPLPATAQ